VADNVLNELQHIPDYRGPVNLFPLKKLEFLVDVTSGSNPDNLYQQDFLFHGIHNPVIANP